MSKKKVILAGFATLLAGISIYKIISTKKNKRALPVDVWTEADIPNLSGKVIVVTGANSGIGFVAAKAFARKGAQTILACRNMEKAQAALTQIQTDIPDAKVEIIQLDLASLNSVRQFAGAFKTKYPQLDVLVNNAGIMGMPYARTVDGFESHFGVNHLGHFALTGLLIDELTAAQGARVVNVSSVGHRLGRLDFDNMMYENGRRYLSVFAYMRSKLANLLFTYELQRRFDVFNLDVIAVAAHPGTSYTNLSAHMEERSAYKLLKPLFDPITQVSTMGAQPIMLAAVAPDVKGGQFFGPDGFMQTKGDPALVQSSKASHNLADAEGLWKFSEEMTGVRYLGNEIEIK